jgi:hypothetical protein
LAFYTLETFFDTINDPNIADDEDAKRGAALTSGKVPSETAKLQSLFSNRFSFETPPTGRLSEIENRRRIGRLD